MCEELELSVKYPKLGPSSTKTKDEMRCRDENNTLDKNKGDQTSFLA
jgi:hypothetical protein